jgi:hypothetical protein
MAVQTRATLKNWFLRGFKPLASQFSDWMDSYWHQNDSIPIGSINGLQTILNSIQTLVGSIVATGGGIITLDLADTKQGLFVGDNPIGAGKTIVLANAGSAIRLSFIFNITGAYGLIFPAAWKMNPDPKWDNSGAAPVWTPIDAGQYQADASFDGANWNMIVSGPFS